MSKHEWKRSISVVGRMLLAYALILSQCAWAGQNPKTTGKANLPQQTSARAGEKQPSAAPAAKAQSEEARGEASESAVAEEKPSRDGSREAIKVHGHWTIEVRNADGTVATHREFENSLFPKQGSGLLITILAGQNIVGAWSLDLSSTTVQPCATSAGGTSCQIFETGDQISGGNNLFLTLSVSASGTGSLVLSGTAVAGQTGNIDTVTSRNDVCTIPSVTPATCASGTIGLSQRYIFTTANINPPVNISFGQTVAVTVTFTFS